MISGFKRVNYLDLQVSVDSGPRNQYSKNPWHQPRGFRVMGISTMLTQMGPFPPCDQVSGQYSHKYFRRGEWFRQRRTRLV